MNKTQYKRLIRYVLIICSLMLASFIFDKLGLSSLSSISFIIASVVFLAEPIKLLFEGLGWLPKSGRRRAFIPEESAFVEAHSKMIERGQVKCLACQTKTPFVEKEPQKLSEKVIFRCQKCFIPLFYSTSIFNV